VSDYLADASAHVQNALTTVESLAELFGFTVTSHLVLHLGMAQQAVEEAKAEKEPIISFETLGVFVEEGPEVTVTIYGAEGHKPAFIALAIDGGERNEAEVRLTAAEAHRLSHLLARAERRLAGEA
jgi:hypothetical protein